MDFALDFINMARMIGSFLCFQREEATFRIGTEYFPVCSGCFGIYLGSFVALCAFPFLTKYSKKLYSVRYGLPMLLPLAMYWAILNIQFYTGNWLIPGINEIYAFLGVLFGATISNTAYNLALEAQRTDIVSRIGAKFWLLAVVLSFVTLIMFLLRPAEVSILFSVSLVFLLGLFGLSGFLVAWVLLSLASHSGEEKQS